MRNTANYLLRTYTPAVQEKLLKSTQKEQAAFMGSNGIMEYLAYRAQLLEAFVNTNQQTFRYWLVLDKGSKRVLGDCGFHRWYHLQQVAELGYGLRKESDYNKGIMSEVIADVLDIGFNEMDLERVEAFVKVDNYASLKILHKMGFKAEARLNNRVDRGQADTLLLALLRENFPLKLSEVPYTIQAFERGTLPGDFWTHKAHLEVGLWYALNYELELAILKMRKGIMAYNQITGIPNTASRGYHETMTHFWIRTLKQFVEKHPMKSYDCLLEKLLQSDCGQKNYPLRFYSKKQIQSLKARATYIPPEA